ncbi:MAG: chemotaxis protein CheA [Spirochaetaceae bacterium]|nr:chemotaxis protein CheA [Myxococcales bacterium]MCB9726382.1 chemotaxis protein CheA [Spirochaetaceae bacterium]
MSDLDEELVLEFKIESQEHLGTVEPALLEIEGADPERRNELVHLIFRAVHSVKGASGFFELNTIQALSHTMENLLMRVRDGEIEFVPAMTDALLGALDVLGRLIEALPEALDPDISEQTELLTRLTHEPGDGAPAAQPPPPSSAQAPPAEVPPAAPAAAASPKASPSAGAEAPPKAAAEDKANPARRTDASAETIRVPVHLLDRLMDQAGELVLSRNQLLSNMSATTDPIVKGILQDLDLITSELQSDIMNTRMQPVGVVFNKFNRIVRDLSRTLDKEVQLQIEGSEVELDKSIVELLSDPLTHLVRNSLDHGIEPPALRAERGKNRQGTVALRAFHEGGQVHIEIEDDGAGIDPEKMRRVAIEKGVITRDEAIGISDADARMLIFAPGFSTAAQVSNVSGRGVGMDVVKTNISKLGGKIEVESEVGRGSKLTIALPLTLAIIPSLIVAVAGQRLAIPQVNLVELVRVRFGDRERLLSDVNGAAVLRLRGNLLPLVDLRVLLGLEPAVREAEWDDPPAMHIAVLQVGGTHFGLIVDAILDSEEIVVKPLSELLEGNSLYSGATIMGDGRVAMILDAAGIAEYASLRLEEKRVASHGAEKARTNERLQRRRLVIFNNADEDQFAIDLDRLVRLERILPSQIEEVGNRPCIQYRGRGLPLVRLHEELPVRPLSSDRKELYVLIPRLSGEGRGILAGSIVDAVETEFEMDTDPSAHRAIEGRAVIGGRLTLLLDPEYLGGRPVEAAVA